MITGIGIPSSQSKIPLPMVRLPTGSINRARQRSEDAVAVRPERLLRCRRQYQGNELGCGLVPFRDELKRARRTHASAFMRRPSDFERIVLGR